MVKKMSEAMKYALQVAIDTGEPVKGRGRLRESADLNGWTKGDGRVSAAGTKALMEAEKAKE